MESYNGIFDKLLTELNTSINNKISGIHFLELLKYELIEKLKDLDQKNSEELKLLFTNQNSFENQINMDNRPIKYKIEHFNKSESIIKQKTKNDLLCIILEGLKIISVFDNNVAEKSIQSNLTRNMGIVLVKNTVISAKITKKSIMLSILNI